MWSTSSWERNTHFTSSGSTMPNTSSRNCSRFAGVLVSMMTGSLPRITIEFRYTNSGAPVASCTECRIHVSGATSSGAAQDGRSERCERSCVFPLIVPAPRPVAADSCTSAPRRRDRAGRRSAAARVEPGGVRDEAEHRVLADHEEELDELRRRRSAPRARRRSRPSSGREGVELVGGPDEQRRRARSTVRRPVARPSGDLRVGQAGVACVRRVLRELVLRRAVVRDPQREDLVVAPRQGAVRAPARPPSRGTAPGGRVGGPGSAWSRPARRPAARSAGSRSRTSARSSAGSGRRDAVAGHRAERWAANDAIASGEDAADHVACALDRPRAARVAGRPRTSR